MPRSRRTRISVWKNLRVVKIGMPTQSSLPCAVAIISDDIDISEMSKSWNFSCRQNISDGWMTVGMRSMPSGFTVPSRIGHDRGLAAVARLS